LVIDQQRASVETALTDYYSAAGSWAGVQQDWGEIMRAGQAGSVQYGVIQEGNGPPQGLIIPRHDETERRNLFGLASTNGVWVVPLDQQAQAGAAVPGSLLTSGTQIMVGGQNVGVLLTADRLPRYNPAEMLFLQRTNQALILAVLVALIAALLIGIVLARTLTRPLRELTLAAEGVAAGDLQQQVTVRSNDEIGDLASAFNKMSQEVARENQLRQQMTADVAHDLRTPLTVIAGYVESMRDGVLAPTEERLGLIYGEIERLQNLVGELRTLSQADSGDLQINRQPVDVKALLERSAQVFQLRADQQGVELAVDTSQDIQPLPLDESRMLQVMDNLLSNALRYTPAGGRITLSARNFGSETEISVSDTGTGIPQADLPHIFERFHRADPSRHTELDESGLGLAIVRAIVEAHHGKTSAESSPHQGTTIKILLPNA